MRGKMNIKRYAMPDSLRGLTLISMVIYHTVWDMVYIFGLDWAWYKSDWAHVWQQSICWCFILLSGFCWSFGKVKWKRGLIVFLAGVLITAVTLIVMPAERIVFGVLTFLGTAMLLMIPLDRLFCKWKPGMGLVFSMALFVLFRNVNDGWLGFGTWNLWELPGELYSGMFATYLGFTQESFFSADYFSVFPWIFLFSTGYFLHGVVKERNWMKYLAQGRCAFLEKLGKHSLVVYMLHQPVAYGVLWVCFALRG